MLTQNQMEQIYYLCQDNETLKDIFCQFCESIDEELGMLNQKVRSELAVLATSNQLLLEQNPSLKLQKQWSIIEDDYNHLYDLMEKYEDYRNHFRMKKNFVNVTTLCKKIATNSKKVAKEQNITFSYENRLIVPQVLEHYYCDGQRLADAILGLLKHAFYSIPEVSCVHMRLENTDSTHAVFYIERDGAMLQKKELEDLTKEHISKEIYNRHVGILTAKHFADCCKFDFTISSTPEKTYVSMVLPAIQYDTQEEENE